MSISFAHHICICSIIQLSKLCCINNLRFTGNSAGNKWDIIKHFWYNFSTCVRFVDIFRCVFLQKMTLSIKCLNRLLCLLWNYSYYWFFLIFRFEIMWNSFVYIISISAVINCVIKQSVPIVNVKTSCSFHLKRARAITTHYSR